MNFKCFGQKILNKYHSPMPQQAFRRHLLICFAAAVLLRIVLAWPALNDPATLLRPDSMGYWNPARAVAAGDGLVSEPGSDTLEVIRPVGYIAWLAAGILCSGDSLLFAGVMGILISAATIFPLAWGVQKLCGSKRAGTVGAWLWAVCITPIGAAPLILSDTLLGLLSAYQFCAAVYFIQDKKIWQFALLSLAAMAGALTKTVNLPVVLVGLPVILLAAWLPWQDTWRAILIWLVLFCAVIMPYWVRNYSLCGDFDGNSANLYFHNGSAIMARATGESSEVWRNKLLQKAEQEFAADPERYSTLKAQNQWKKSQYRQMAADYPRETALAHLPNIFNLMPDVPSLLENNHITSGERGTMAVLRREGFTAAVNHYLDGRWTILIFLLPLLVIYAAFMLAALIQLCIYFKRRQWPWLLLFGVQVFYYILAPGPVISGRYLLPALPMLIAMAVQFTVFQRKKTEFSEANIQEKGAL